jgi:hypothetical protein
LSFSLHRPAQSRTILITGPGSGIGEGTFSMYMCGKLAVLVGRSILLGSVSNVKCYRFTKGSEEKQTFISEFYLFLIGLNMKTKLEEARRKGFFAATS